MVSGRRVAFRRAPRRLGDARVVVWAVLAGCGGDGGPAAGGDAGQDAAVDAEVDAVVDAADAGAGSPGCGSVAPAVPLDDRRMLDFDGTTRSYLVHVPASYVAGRPTAVIVGLHGDTPASFGDAATYFQDKLTGLLAKSDAAGFILVAPEGLTDVASVGATWNGGSCCAKDKKRDDVGFVRAVVDAVGADLCVDGKRVFATGFSSGAFMSYRLACEAADVFAAVAPVAGLTGVDPCTPSRPVSVIDFAGTADPGISYGGPLTGVNVTAEIARWVARDACAPTSTQTFATGDSHCDTWGCAGGTGVTLCTVDGGGHAWPGGLDLSAYGLGKTTKAISADDAMWDFFVAHPMP